LDLEATDGIKKPINKSIEVEFLSRGEEKDSEDPPPPPPPPAPAAPEPTATEAAEAINELIYVSEVDVSSFTGPPPRPSLAGRHSIGKNGIVAVSFGMRMRIDALWLKEFKKSRKLSSG
jgi:hypothetical protein